MSPRLGKCPSFARFGLHVEVDSKLIMFINTQIDDFPPADLYCNIRYWYVHLGGYT